MDVLDPTLANVDPQTDLGFSAPFLAGEVPGWDENAVEWEGDSWREFDDGPVSNLWEETL